MKVSKEYIEKAHAQGCYVDRSDGTIYPATPRTTFLNAVNELTHSYGVRLYHCKAEIFLCDYSDFFKCCPILLRSYATFVAIYIPNTDRLFVFDYYSNTTTQHIAKFRKFLNANYFRVIKFPIYRRVRDKQGSHIEYEPFIPFVNE